MITNNFITRRSLEGVVGVKYCQKINAFYITRTSVCVYINNNNTNKKYTVSSLKNSRHRIGIIFVDVSSVFFVIILQKNKKILFHTRYIRRVGGRVGSIQYVCCVSVSFKQFLLLSE